MPNDENKIILEFPATNVEIELGETITFDNISGFLDSGRVTYNGDSLTEEITHLENDKADTTYVNTELDKKADKTDTYTKTQVDNIANAKLDKANPTGTGSFSLNRKANTTIGYRSVATGYNTTASGMNSHSEGVTTTSSGMNSHSEGANTIASGNNSHSEGFSTTASGSQAHSEGTGTIASGNNSHSEGAETTASGERSHAEGLNTEAKGNNQHVSGKYNIVDNNDEYAEIIGNGTSESNRSNARTLDWQGNETLAGDVIINGNQSVSGEITRLDGRITDLPEAMVFKGTLGVGGTIETLPTASAENEGWMFKCITAGTYAGLTLKVGDTVTCFNPPNTSTYYWDKTGSQDTDTDTWRNIKVNGVEKLGNGISSGAVDFEDTANVKFEFDANGNKVRAKLEGIYTDSEVDDLLDDKADADNTYTKEQVDDIVYNILPDDTASGSVANFETSLEMPIKSLEVNVNAVQSAGTPTPASPLSISGWSEIKIRRCGKNLVDIRPFNEWETARVSYYVLRNSVPNKVINVSLIDKDTTVDLTGVSFGFVDSSWDTTAQLTESEYRWVIQGGTPQTIKRNTAIGNSNNVLTGLMISPQTEEAYNKIMARYYFEFEIGTATEYEAYNGKDVTIALGGTYYGGHFTQDKDGHRQFEVTHALTTVSEMDNNRSWYYSTSNGFWINEGLANTIVKTASGSEVTTAISDYFETVSRNNLKNADDRLCVNTSGYVCIYGSELPTTKNEFLSSVGNAKLVYPLATPYVIDLPDGEPINTLIGTNNIFADTGDTNVVFKDSVNGYVEKKIASVQALALNT